MRMIYIVEDDEGIREVLEILLDSEDYSFKSFADVEKFKNRDLLVVPDLYIFDVRLPDGSGIDLCNEIRHDGNPDVPIMMMSAHANPTSIQAQCSPDSFISKPFDIDNFLSKIRTILA
ncbi:response regulator [Sphingobacterium deserti]|uniref:Response regulator receiver protein n=2 Tax=Sphingobacterium TaxID=28453 RepID=A0A0B8SYY6_9SPHI|nr:response regulator [Sphingobacterium deserti]KGE12476.1 response regulator receiver protein [Sphingobacterium deserti]